MNRVALRAGAVPAPIRAVCIVIPLCVAAYWCIAYAGPYRWLAETQIDLTGGYEIILTGVGVVLLSLLPSIVLIQVLASVYLRREAPNAVERRAIDMRGQDERIRANIGYIFAAALFVGLAGTGAYFLISGLTAGDPVTLDVARLEAGAHPGSRQATLTGRLRLDDALEIEEKSGSSTIEKVYVPLVSSKWRPGDPVVVYLETYHSWLSMYAKDLAAGPYRGLLDENALPGLLRSDLERRRQLPSGSHWVLNYRASADEHLTIGLSLGAAAGIIGLITAAIAIVRSRRKT